MDQLITVKSISWLCLKQSGLTYCCSLHTHGRHQVFDTIWWDLKLQPLWHYKLVWKSHSCLQLPAKWVGTHLLGRHGKWWEHAQKRMLVEQVQGAALIRLETDCVRSWNINTLSIWRSNVTTVWFSFFYAYLFFPFTFLNHMTFLIKTSHDLITWPDHMMVTWSYHMTILYFYLMTHPLLILHTWVTLTPVYVSPILEPVSGMTP